MDLDLYEVPRIRKSEQIRIFYVELNVSKII
jgi:hypothetical protein